MKKYELTEETINFYNRTLYRIKALKAFNDVKVGDLGGYVESEDNLSQEGNCWIYNNAKVCSNALISGNAKIYDNAQVYGYAYICDNARVYGYAQVFDNARVYNNVRVLGQIFGDAQVCDNIEVYENLQVYDLVQVGSKDQIYGNAKIHNQLDLKKYLNKQRLIEAINYL